MTRSKVTKAKSKRAARQPSRRESRRHAKRVAPLTGAAAGLRFLRGGANGVLEWNSRRIRNPHPNLRQVDLAGVDLQGAILTNADLRSANLTRSDLSHAVLRRADLRRANLDGATLRYASLEGANLRGAALRNANLEGANLLNADLASVDLEGSNFHNARVGATIFANIDLSGVRNLDTVVHAAPSTLGLDTVLMSKGKIPESFLRKCDYDPRLQSIVLGERAVLLNAARSGASPQHFQTCFISYCSKDRDFADRLENTLNARGVEHWYAPEHGIWGRNLVSQIDDQIARVDKVLLICSHASLEDSDWVQWELERAFIEEDKRGTEVVLPIMIDDAFLTWNHPRATRLRNTLAGDFRNVPPGRRFGKRVDKLLDALRLPRRVQLES